MNTNAIFASFIAGILMGVVTCSVMAPIPIPKKDCDIYRVANEVATSYVLKAPPAPPAERVIVKEACVTPTPENVSKPEITNADETQEKPRRRHRRMRAIWR